MPRLQSAFAKAAKSRRRRPLSKTQRLARSPRHPRAAELAMALLLRRSIERLGRAVLAMSLERFAKSEDTHTDAADGSGPEIPGADTVIRGVRFEVGGASKGIASKVQRNSESEFKRLGIDTRKEPKLGTLIDVWRKENANRAESLVGFERDKLAEILDKGWGKSVPELRQRIEERLDVSRAKADLLARDQVLKLNANITRERHLAAGITEYIWTTSRDERVRSAHEDLDGETFDWDDPPVTNEVGDTNHPGEDYQCRCVAFPVLPELNGNEPSGTDDEPDVAEGYQAEISDPEEAAQYQRELSSKEVPDEVEETGDADRFRELLNGIKESELSSLREGYREPLTVLDGLSAKEATEITTGAKIPKGSRRPLPPIKVAIYPDDQLVLVDGRHRMAAAQKAGAKKIRAKIIHYDDELNVLWEGDRIIKTPTK